TGDTLAAAGFEKTLRLFDTTTGKVKQEIGGPCVDMRTIAFAHDGQTIAAAGRNGCIRVWDNAQGEVLSNRRDAHQRRIRALEFSPDAKLLASGSEDGRVRVWSVPQNEMLLELNCRTAKVMSLVFVGPRKIATGGTDNDIRLWDLSTGDETDRLYGHKGSVGALAYDPGRQRLASGSFDTTIRLWNLNPDRGDETVRTPLDDRYSR
ncbi:MAG: WD40 repeat domain-containing protein, partial [Pirellulales bacterium]